jgi:hypothetical protein
MAADAASPVMHVENANRCVRQRSSDRIWDKKWASDWSEPNSWKFWFGEAAALVNLAPLGPDGQGLASPDAVPYDNPGKPSGHGQAPEPATMHTWHAMQTRSFMIYVNIYVYVYIYTYISRKMT